MIYDMEELDKFICINESTIADSIYKFMRKFYNDVFLYSADETIKFLENKMEEVEKKYGKMA